MLARASFESIRHEGWTLIRSIDEAPTVQLFRTTDDPGERVDVAAEHPDVVADLLQRMEASVRTATERADAFGGVNLRDLSDDQIEALRGLGYADDG